MSEAIYVMVIARSTGWSEHYIRWSLPLTRGWAYYHAARLLDGRPMSWPEATDPATAGWWQRVQRSVADVWRRVKK